MKNIKFLTPWLLTLAVALALNLALGINLFLAFGILAILSLMLPNLKGTLNTVVSNPLIGRAKQSMGGVTFSTWKGINVLKNKATTVANPQTGAQISQRSAFSQMVALFRNDPAAIRAGFKKQAVKKSEFNAFMSANLDNAFDRSVPGVASIIPANLVFAKGTISSTAPITTTADRSNNTIVTTFAATVTQPGESLTDLALVSAYNITQDLSYGEVSAAQRSTGTSSIALPLDWAVGDSVRVYLGFSNPLSGESADSSSILTTIIA